jgi:nucleotide-binding universal stress UspA family protein
MYNKILVPMALDHDISPDTLEIARGLMAKGGSITALHVHEALHGSVSAYVNEDAVRAGFDSAQKRLEEKTAHIDGVKPDEWERFYNFARPHGAHDCGLCP